MGMIYDSKLYILLVGSLLVISKPQKPHNLFDYFAIFTISNNQ